jgi:hypothetical protein
MKTRILTLAALLALTGSASAAQETKAAVPITTTPNKVDGMVALAAPASQSAAPVSAPAPTPAVVKVEGTQSWWQSLLVDLIMSALAIFVPVLSALGFLLLRKLGVKVDLATLDSLAGKAALYAEKKASTTLGEGKPKSTGAQKEEWAWDLIKSVDAKLAGSEKAKEKLRALILAKIPEAEATMAAAAPAKKEG